LLGDKGWEAKWIRFDGARLAPDDPLNLFLSDKDKIEVHLEKIEVKNAAAAAVVVKSQPQPQQSKVIVPVEDTRKKASMFFHTLASEVAAPTTPLEEVAQPITDLAQFEQELASFFEGHGESLLGPDGRPLTVAELQEFQGVESVLEDYDDGPLVEMCHAVCLYNFNPEEEDEIAFRVGDEVVVYRQRTDGWWKGRVVVSGGVSVPENGKVGYFPGNRVKVLEHVSVVKPLPETPTEKEAEDAPAVDDHVDAGKQDEPRSSQVVGTSASSVLLLEDEVDVPSSLLHSDSDDYDSASDHQPGSPKLDAVVAAASSSPVFRDSSGGDGSRVSLTAAADADADAADADAAASESSAPKAVRRSSEGMGLKGHGSPETVRRMSITSVVVHVTPASEVAHASRLTNYSGQSPRATDAPAESSHSPIVAEVVVSPKDVSSSLGAGVSIAKTPSPTKSEGNVLKKGSDLLSEALADAESALADAEIVLNRGTKNLQPVEVIVEHAQPQEAKSIQLSSVVVQPAPTPASVVPSGNGVTEDVHGAESWRFSTVERQISSGAENPALPRRSVSKSSTPDAAAQQRVEKAYRKLQAKKYDAVAELLNPAIAAYPHYAQALYLRGAASEALRQVSSALNDYSKAIAYRPKYLEALLARGRLALHARKLAVARHDYTAALAIDENCFDALMGLGRVELEQSNVPWTRVPNPRTRDFNTPCA
jgi:hypothetical protein